MQVSRRSVLKFAAAGVMAIPLRALAQTQPVDDRLIYCAPLTHSDWMLKPGTVWGDAGVRHMLDQCKACGWSNVLWRAFDAGQATYASKLLKPGIKSEADTIFSPQTDEGRAAVKKLLPNLTPERSAEVLKQMAAIDYSTFDSLAYAIQYGHSIGLKIHAWATINEDDHGWGWTTEFSKAHPEFRWVRRDGKPYHSQLSFAFEPVRDYKLGLIRELLAYDIDGLFLDWIRTGDIRDNPQTDEKGVANSGYEAPNVEAYKMKFGIDAANVPNDDARWVQTRAEPQTIFMRGVRKMLREEKPMPISVMVGHPWHYRGTGDKIDGNLRGLLLDVKTWANEGLMDSAIAAGYYRDGGNASLAYKALKDETGGKVDIWYFGWVPSSVAEVDRDVAAAKELGAKQVLYWEADYIDDRANAAELKSAMSAKAKL